MHSFWKWAYKKVKTKARNSHLAVYHNDIKCPTCNEWFSISGITSNHTITHSSCDTYSFTTCGQCKHTSKWNLVAFPFPALVTKDNGL